MFETRLTALHIDVARFASDDFNPFHDRHKWQRIAGNPFGGPIALGFQLGACGLEAVRDVRGAAASGGEPRYSTLQIRFIDALRADDTLSVTVRDRRAGGDARAHRFVVRRNGRTAALGALRGGHSAPPAVADEAAFARALDQLPDRSVVPGGGWFLKRKFMLTANAKNFLAAAGIDPFRYFDELENRVRFPEIYPASLISSALLEHGLHQHHDFMAEPMIYSHHEITTNLDALQRLRSNDRLNIVVSHHPTRVAQRVLHRCLGFTARGERLFTAGIGLVPLASLPACVGAGEADGGPE
jgi:hypothetical protein